MIFAIDIGSSVLKGGLISPTGELIALQKVPVEFETTSWLHGLKKVSRIIRPYKKQIRAIAVSGNGPTIVAVAGDGKALDSPVSWMDHAADRYLAEITDKIGHTVAPEYFLAKIYYLFREKPQVYAQTSHFLPCPEYINFFLTGNPAVILYSPSAEPFLWNEPALTGLGLDPGKFPAFVAPGQITGQVTKAAAAFTGIPAGIPVVTCGTDFLMSLIGTATLQSGRVCNRTGTSEGLNACIDHPLTEPGLLQIPHLIPGFYNVSGLLDISGGAVEWIKQQTGYGGLAYSLLYAKLARIKPALDNPLCLPFFVKNRTPLWKPELRAAFAGLQLHHTGLHMVKAVLEATGYAMRDIIQAVEGQGIFIREITVSGTPAGYSDWNQLRADLTGKKILQPRITDAELTGAACLGYCALGVYQNLSEAAGKMVRIRNQYTPDQAISGLYDKLYIRYREFYNSMAGLRS